MTLEERHPKYVVVKRATWTRLREQLATGPLTTAEGTRRQLDADEQIIADAIVLRPRDVFAGPAVDAYVRNIRSATRFARMLRNKKLSGLAEVDAIEQYERLADLFEAAGKEADEADHKVPD